MVFNAIKNKDKVNFPNSGWNLPTSKQSDDMLDNIGHRQIHRTNNDNNTEYNLKKEIRCIKKILNHAIKVEGLKDIYFNVILVDNPTIHDLNKEYRNIDRETDVISFALLD